MPPKRPKPTNGAAKQKATKKPKPDFTARHEHTRNTRANTRRREEEQRRANEPVVNNPVVDGPVVDGPVVVNPVVVNPVPIPPPIGNPNPNENEDPRVAIERLDYDLTTYLCRMLDLDDVRSLRLVSSRIRNKIDIDWPWLYAAEERDVLYLAISKWHYDKILFLLEPPRHWLKRTRRIILNMTMGAIHDGHLMPHDSDEFRMLVKSKAQHDFPGYQLIVTNNTLSLDALAEAIAEQRGLVYNKLYFPLLTKLFENCRGLGHNNKHVKLICSAKTDMHGCSDQMYKQSFRRTFPRVVPGPALDSRCITADIEESNRAGLLALKAMGSLRTLDKSLNPLIGLPEIWEVKIGNPATGQASTGRPPTASRAEIGPTTADAAQTGTTAESGTIAESEAPATSEITAAAAETGKTQNTETQSGTAEAGETQTEESQSGKKQTGSQDKKEEPKPMKLIGFTVQGTPTKTAMDWTKVRLRKLPSYISRMADLTFLEIDSIHNRDCDIDRRTSHLFKNTRLPSLRQLNLQNVTLDRRSDTELFFKSCVNSLTTMKLLDWSYEPMDPHKVICYDSGREHPYDDEWAMCLRLLARETNLKTFHISRWHRVFTAPDNDHITAGRQFTYEPQYRTWEMPKLSYAPDRIVNGNTWWKNVLQYLVCGEAFFGKAEGEFAGHKEFLRWIEWEKVNWELIYGLMPGWTWKDL